MRSARRDHDELERLARRQIVHGYAELVQRRVADGWSPFLLTFMFHALRGGPLAIILQMRREVERAYAMLATRVVRDPRSPSAVGRLPVMIACADLPVPKRDKIILRDVTLNGGLHYNGVLLVPPRSRLRVPVDEHFASGPYVVPGHPLARLDVRHVENDPGRVTDYVLKTVRSGHAPTGPADRLGLSSLWTPKLATSTELGYKIFRHKERLAWHG